MTRHDAITEQDRLFGPQLMLPEICMNLRMAVNGSADPWPPEQVRETVAMFWARLATWQVQGQRSKRVDDAVRELVAATLAEVEEYLR